MNDGQSGRQNRSEGERFGFRPTSPEIQRTGSAENQ